MRRGRLLSNRGMAVTAALLCIIGAAIGMAIVWGTP